MKKRTTLAFAAFAAIFIGAVANATPVLAQVTTLDAFAADALRQQAPFARMPNYIGPSPMALYIPPATSPPAKLQVKRLINLEYAVARGGTLDVDALHTVAEIDLPFDRGCCIHCVGNGRALIGGVNYTAQGAVGGIVQIGFATSETSPTVHHLGIERTEQYSFDPQSIVVIHAPTEGPPSGGIMIVSDYNSNSIMEAPWDGILSALPAESVFNPLWTQSQCAPLIDDSTPELIVEGWNTALVASSEPDTVWHAIWQPAGAWHKAIQQSQSTTVSDFQCRSRVAFGAVDGLEVRGPSQFEIVDDLGNVIYTGTPSGTAWHATGALPALNARPGRRHVIRPTATGTRGPAFHPILHIGSPGGVAAPSRGLVPVPLFSADPFGGLVGVELPSGNGAGTINGICAVGLLDPSQSNVVFDSGGSSAALQWSDYTEFSVSTADHRGKVGTSLSFQHANGMNDLIPVYQVWLRMPDGNLGFSDVFGAMIDDASAGSTPSSISGESFGRTVNYGVPSISTDGLSFSGIESLVRSII
jgi:hypothetical protein